MDRPKFMDMLCADMPSVGAEPDGDVTDPEQASSPSMSDLVAEAILEYLTHAEGQK